MGGIVVKMRNVKCSDGNDLNECVQGSHQEECAVELERKACIQKHKSTDMYHALNNKEENESHQKTSRMPSHLYISSSNSDNSQSSLQSTRDPKQLQGDRLMMKNIPVFIKFKSKLGSPATPIYSPTANLRRISQLTVDISSDSSSEENSLVTIKSCLQKSISISFSSFDSSFSSIESDSSSSDVDFTTSQQEGQVYDWLNSTSSSEIVADTITGNDLDFVTKSRMLNVAKISIPYLCPKTESASHFVRSQYCVKNSKMRQNVESIRDVNSHIVKDTMTVSRKKADLPTDKPDARSGNWLTNRLIVNQYIILHDLGKGSYAQVRLCKEKTTNSLFAMKIMNKSLLGRKLPGSSSVMEGVKREIAIMKKLRHYHVLRLYEVINDPSCNKLYLVLEYMKGGDLYRPEPMNDVEVWRVSIQVLLGLSYLHQNNIIHGDIKPQNILLNDHGDVKIADFGISKILEGDEKQLDTTGS